MSYQATGDTALRPSPIQVYQNAEFPGRPSWCGRAIKKGDDVWFGESDYDVAVRTPACWQIAFTRKFGPLPM